MEWHPASWQSKPATQQPRYPDPEAAARVVEEMAKLPPLVTSWEVESLRDRLAKAALGEMFLLQGGDCAESFDDCDSGAIAAKLKILLQMSLVLVQATKKHVIRVGRCLGLTRYRAPGWRMAEEITASLGRLDPADPTRYDFALCHLGMQDRCGFQRSARDARCPLRGLCRPGARTRRRSRAPSDRR